MELSFQNMLNKLKQLLSSHTLQIILTVIVITLPICTFCGGYYQHPLFYYYRSQHDIAGLTLDEENERLFILADDILERHYYHCYVEVVCPARGRRLIDPINIATGYTQSETSAGLFGGWGCDVDDAGNLYVNSFYGQAVNKMVPPDFMVEYATTGWSGHYLRRNTADNRTTGVTVIEENNFVLLLNRVDGDVGTRGIQGWRNASHTEGKQEARKVLAFDDPRGISNDGTYIYVGNNNINFGYALHALRISDYSNPQYFIYTGSNRIVDIACDGAGYVWVLFENNSIRRYAGAVLANEAWDIDHHLTPAFSFNLPEDYGNFQSIAVSKDGKSLYAGWSKGYDQASGVLLFTSEKYTSASSWSLFK